VRLQLLYFEDCPNWKVTADRLDALAAERGATVERVLIDTPQDAEQWRFPGSPTVRVNGVDPFADPDLPFGLACRVYTTPDGLAGSPTLEQLRAVLGDR
jgi:hypothetical protein